MNKKIAIALLCAACSYANAVEWTPIGVAFDGSYAYIDFSRITKKQGLTTAWIKQEYQTYQIGEPRSNYASYNIVLWRGVFDCASAKSATGSMIYYGERRTPVSQWDAKDWQLGFSAIIPGSYGDQIFSIVCGVTQPPKNSSQPSARKLGV